MRLSIKTGSITNAQRGRVILNKYGYNAAIRKNSHPSKDEGCGYILIIRCDSREPIDILNNNGVKILGVDEI